MFKLDENYIADRSIFTCNSYTPQYLLRAKRPNYPLLFGRPSDDS